MWCWGDYQFLPGYCVLLHSPCVESLNELTPAGRAQFLKDMTLIGDAIMAVCHPLRLNYAILMNYDNFLHAHIQARYAWEPEVYGKGSVWNYPQAHRCDDKYFFTGEQYLALQKKIKVALSELLDSIGYWEDTACP